MHILKDYLNDTLYIMGLRNESIEEAEMFMIGRKINEVV